MKKDSSNPDNKYISIPDYARLVGKSRIAIYKQVKSGQIPAQKIGRNYVILHQDSDSSQPSKVKIISKNKPYISIAKLAQQLGISRIAVYKKIKQGKIAAMKAGRNYIIPLKDLQKQETQTKEKAEQTVSIPQLAKELGISRIAVFKQVKAGKIKAVKCGRNYIIARKDISELPGNNSAGVTKWL